MKKQAVTDLTGFGSGYPKSKELEFTGNISPIEAHRTPMVVASPTHSRFRSHKASYQAQNSASPRQMMKLQSKRTFVKEMSIQPLRKESKNNMNNTRRLFKLKLAARDSLNDSSFQESSTNLSYNQYLKPGQKDQGSPQEPPVQLPKIQSIIGKSVQMTEDFELTFRKVCQQEGSATLLKNLRLSKGQLKLHIAKRYKKMIGDRIMQFLEIVYPNLHNLNIHSYMKLLDELICTPGRLIDFTFHVYDFSSTGSLCEHDAFQLMQNFPSEGPGSSKEAIFVKAFAQDFCKMSKALDQKKSKSNSIANRLRRQSSKLSPNLLDTDNSDDAPKLVKGE